MATCTHCTRTLPEDAATCPFCGTKVAHATKENTDPEKDYLYFIRKNLRQEQQAWRLFGLALVLIAAVSLGGAIMSYLTRETVSAVIYAVVAILCLPAIPVNFTQYGNVDNAVTGIYIDCTPALERMESASIPLLGLFFNPFALWFFLSNRAFIRKNEKELDALRRIQDQRYDSTFRNDRFHSIQ